MHRLHSLKQPPERLYLPGPEPGFLIVLGFLLLPRLFDAMIDSIICRVIAREGGFVDHPADRGGPTNMGITQATLAHWRGKPVTAQEVKDLGRDEAVALYRRNYWSGPGLDTLGLNEIAADMVFDTAVHHGPRTAIRLLQRAAGVKDDGLIGPITRRAVADAPARQMAARFIAKRAEVLGRIISRKHSQAAFAHGWFRRLGAFIRLIPEV